MHTAKIVGAVGAAQRAHAEHVVAQARVYPPEKAGSDYVRTGDLGDSFVVRGPSFSASGISTRITNTVSYFGYVMGDEQQQQHADTGWQKLQDRAERQRYRQVIQEAIHHAL